MANFSMNSRDGFAVVDFLKVADPDANQSNDVNTSEDRIKKKRNHFLMRLLLIPSAI